MCFSTSASFTAGAVLAVIGIAAIKKADTRAAYCGLKDMNYSIT